LVLELFKQKLDIDFENNYYLNIPRPPRVDEINDYGDSVISGLFVDLTEELIEAIIRWLKKRRKMANPNLEISIEGNLLNVNVQDMEQLLQIIKEWGT